MERDTIAAIATPIGCGGIGIIRLSGNQAIAILDRLFRPKGTSSLDKYGSSRKRFPSHRMRYGTIHDLDNGQLLDEVLAVAMHTPQSYTREDVVEIQSHGGPVMLDTILAQVLHAGARLAAPGEFTKRAFLNGRVDLSQAEAVADIVNARTKAALALTTTQLNGGMREIVAHAENELDAIRATVEAQLEFGDELEENQDPRQFCKTLTDSVMKPLQRLLDSYDDQHVLRDGIRISIIGRPNVGKSSLLNRFLLRDRAIVTDIPGTTRDLVEDHMAIDGIPIQIVDTAGLHDAQDPVESAGIMKTRQSMQDADIILMLIDGAAGVTEKDLQVWADTNQAKTLLAVNKIDLVKRPDAVSISEIDPGLDAILISAKTGQGIEELKRKIKTACLTDDTITPGKTVVPSRRQKIALISARDALQTTISESNLSNDPIIVMQNLNRVKEELSKISGSDIDADLMDEIFSRFCIGK